MPFTLQQLSDLEDIKLLKHRYFRGIDTADEALLSTLFTDDVSVTYNGGEYAVKLSGAADMVDFLMNSFHSDSVAMHHGHMPEISFLSDEEAEGIWYLEDIFISLERRDYTVGSALYRDIYRKVGGAWKIAVTTYDRIMEVVEPLSDSKKITHHYLAAHGRKPEERTDIAHLITWFD